MESVDGEFLADVYQRLNDAFELKYDELGRKLAAEELQVYQDMYRHCRQNALDTIEDFKITESFRNNNIYIVDYSCDDNLHDGPVYEDNGGWLSVKQNHKQTYAEFRAKEKEKLTWSQLALTFALPDMQNPTLELLQARDNFCWMKYYMSRLPQIMEDFFWGQYLYGQGNKKEGCKYLFDALLYITSCITEKDTVKTAEYIRLERAFEKACRKIHSSGGGRSKFKDLEYLKDIIPVLLQQKKPPEGWRSKAKTIESIAPLLYEYDRKQNPDKWVNDTGKRESLILARVNYWSRNELKETMSEFVSKRKIVQAGKEKINQI